MTRQVRRVHIRLYAGEDDDLLAWMEKLDGRVSQVVKETLRRGKASSAAPPLGASDPGTLRQVVEEIVAALGHHPGAGSGPAIPSVASDPEADGLLEELGAALLLD